LRGLCDPYVTITITNRYGLLSHDRAQKHHERVVMTCFDHYTRTHRRSPTHIYTRTRSHKHIYAHSDGVGGKTKRTKHIRQNLNPEWNFPMTFPVHSVNQILVVCYIGRCNCAREEKRNRERECGRENARWADKRRRARAREQADRLGREHGSECQGEGFSHSVMSLRKLRNCRIYNLVGTFSDHCYSRVCTQIRTQNAHTHPFGRSKFTIMTIWGQMI